MQFDELRAGTVVTAGPRRVTQREIVEFAERYDPQWFHTDPTRAESSRWQGLIASGWHTCSIAMAMVVERILRDSTSIGSPGVDEIRWPKPLRPGDEVSLTVSVLDSRPSRSGNIGIVRWRWELVTQHGDKVLELTATSMFDRRASEASRVGLNLEGGVERG
jgi:acyl dehydratase